MLVIIIADNLRTFLMVFLIHSKSFLAYASVVDDHIGVTIIVNIMYGMERYLYEILYSVTALGPRIFARMILFVWYMKSVAICIAKNFSPNEKRFFISLKSINRRLGQSCLYLNLNIKTVAIIRITNGINDMTLPNTNIEFIL